MDTVTTDAVAIELAPTSGDQSAEIKLPPKNAKRAEQLEQVDFLRKEIAPTVPRDNYLERIQDAIIDGAPFKNFGGFTVEDLANVNLATPIALIYLLCFFAGLGVLTWSGVNTAVSNKFLSLSQPNTAVCESVPQITSGAFQASSSGYWSTKDGFKSNESIYELTFTGSEIDNARYTAVMTKFGDELAKMGAKGASRSLLWSMIAYATFSYEDLPSSMHFYSTVWPSNVFSGQTYAVAVSSLGSGFCNSWSATGGYISGTIDSSTSRATLNIPLKTNNLLVEYGGGNLTYSRLFSASPCNNSYFRNLALDQTRLYRDGAAQVTFNTRSVILVVSLNLGIRNSSGLLRVDTRETAQYGLVGYIDPYQSDMDVVLCVDKTNSKLTADQVKGPEVCFVAIDKFPIYDGSGLYYPSVTHIKKSSSEGLFIYENNKAMFWSGRETMCTCGVNSDDTNDATTYECNINDFALGLIYGSLDSLKTLGFYMQQFLISKPDTGDILMMKALTPLITLAVSVDYGIAYQNVKIKAVDSSVVPNGKTVSGAGSIWGRTSNNNTWASRKSLAQLLYDEHKNLCYMSGFTSSNLGKCANEMGIIAFETIAIDGFNTGKYFDRFLVFLPLHLPEVGTF